ncbi:MAG: hypothetical protein LBN95_04115 [Prevotellaceae bacterium]|jgi:hypothetical protein|nr:hypothetical protein [Prevotellaceae bacterium]
MSEDKSKSVSLKELRENFYINRNLEIKNLWQRSIFLATFMVMCFGAYGKIFETLLNYSQCNEKIAILHSAAIFVGIVGLLISILWVMMSKSSKAWQEVYEITLKELELELEIPEKYRMGNVNHSGTDTNIFSCNAGKYSPSKINIAIGHISFFIWGIIIFGHFFCNICHLLCSFSPCEHFQILILFFNILLLLIAIIIPIILICGKWVKSSFLK